MPKPIEFQIYDWLEDHEIEELDSEDDSGSEDESNKSYNYIIHTFGRTEEGKSVYMKIVNYTPYFYVKLPEAWTKKEAKMKVKSMFSYLTSDMNKKVWKKFRSGLINMDIVERMTPEGFTNGKKYLFARLIFNNSYAMKKFRYLFENSPIYIPGVLKKKRMFKTYEANLPPMLRCFHIMKVPGCGWVNVEKYQHIKKDADKDSFCDIELRVDWKNIKPIEKDTNAYRY
jgi:DNA polymerase elongation subunit (family B)